MTMSELRTRAVIDERFPFPTRATEHNRALWSLMLWALAEDGDVRDLNATTTLRRRLESRGLEVWAPQTVSVALTKCARNDWVVTESRDGIKGPGNRIAVIALDVPALPPYPSGHFECEQWRLSLNGEPSRPVVPMPEPPPSPPVPQPQPEAIAELDRLAQALEEAQRLRRKLSDAVETAHAERMRGDGLQQRVLQLGSELRALRSNIDALLTGTRVDDRTMNELRQLMQAIPTVR